MSEPTASAFLTAAASETALGSLEQHCRMLEGEVLTLRENESRLKQQHQESQRREKVLVRRLAAKEQEMQDVMSQINELKVNQTPGMSSLRSALLDPAVNLILQKLKNELLATKARLEEMQNELSAWKFTPDSNTGKRLMAKCRLLYQENEELGRMTSNGRLAKLEGELALQKGFSDEVKKSQSELDEFMQDVDEDVEGMQSTIYLLQQELVRAKQCAEDLERENEKLRESQDSQSGLLMNGDVSKMEMNDHVSTCKDVLIKDKRDSSDSEPELIIKVSEQDLMKSDLEDDTIKDNCDVRTNSDDVLSPKDTNGVDSLTERTSKANISLDYNKKRNYDSDSSDCSNGHRANSTSVKKARRSSVLSLDYNDMEDDALVISTNGETNVSDVE